MLSRTSARFPPTRMCSRMAVTMNSRSGLLMRSRRALNASSTEVPSVISVVTRSNSVETGGCGFPPTVFSARAMAEPVFNELDSSCSMLASCSLNCCCRRRCRYATTSGGMTKPTAPRMTGPRVKPKPNRPIKAPNATAPMRIRRYSGAVTFRPARARSSVRVGLPATLRRWLRFSAAGLRRRSTNSRGVARAACASVDRTLRSLRTRSRAQKNTKIAAAIGSATIVSCGSCMQGLEEAWVGGLDGLEGHALSRADVWTLRIRRVLARRVVVVRLERVLERRVGQEPRDDLRLALGDDDGEAGRARPGGRCLRPDLDHMELGEDGLGRHLARGGDGRDHRDVVTGLDVVGHTLLLAGRDGQCDVAGRNCQVLRLRAEGLVGPRHLVGGDGLP